MNTLKSHYLYNLNSSNIYKYWVTTVHAEVRKVHSGRISLALKPFLFLICISICVLFLPFPVPKKKKKRERDEEETSHKLD